MILISAGLVLTAIILLIVGFVLTKPFLIMWSIVVCVLSALFLVIGAFLRRHELFPRRTGDATPESGVDRAGGTQPVSQVQPTRAQGPPAQPVRDQPPTQVVQSMPMGMSGMPPGYPPPGAVLGGPPPVHATAAARPPGRPPGSPGAAGVAPEALVLVVPGRRRYHVAGCRQLAGRDIEELTHAEAREEGFSPCTTCLPDAALSGGRGETTGRASAAGVPAKPVPVTEAVPLPAPPDEAAETVERPDPAPVGESAPEAPPSAAEPEPGAEPEEADSESSGDAGSASVGYVAEPTRELRVPKPAATEPGSAVGGWFERTLPPGTAEPSAQNEGRSSPPRKNPYAGQRPAGERDGEEAEESREEALPTVEAKPAAEVASVEEPEDGAAENDGRAPDDTDPGLTPVAALPEGVVKVIEGTRRFHTGSCPLVKGMGETGVETMRREAAEAAGLTGCSVCQDAET